MRNAVRGDRKRTIGTSYRGVAEQGYARDAQKSARVSDGQALESIDANHLRAPCFGIRGR